MQPFHWIDHERWDWFAAGDPDLAPKVRPSPPDENSAQQILFETGLALLIPLALAALIEIILGV
ncbi:MAG TPA: hypothetical protein VMJ73_14875 [Rhizomicrobium sp.]|nr:hypothetical protein [Rhizomicrobium sp.]